MDLFEANRRTTLEQAAPLAARMRPRNLAEIVGHEEVIGEGTLLRQAIERDGEGRFRIVGNTVKFSSSDQTSPIQNGRRYVITVSAFRVSEWLLLALWTAAFAAWPSRSLSTPV